MYIIVLSNNQYLVTVHVAVTVFITIVEDITLVDAHQLAGLDFTAVGDLLVD